MMANKKLINQYKYMYKQTQQITPAIYASLAMALHREFGWGFERINRAFEASQDIWLNHYGNNEDMLEDCFKETGIELRYRK